MYHSNVNINLMEENIIQIKSKIMIHVDASVKKILLNPATCSCKNGKNLASIIDDSVITWNEIIEETKTIRTNFNEKNATCEIENIYILLAFLLITIALLIAVSIYCYPIKYWAKQKQLLPFHATRNKLN